MNDREFGYHVGGLWKCGCGALNAAYLEECKPCNAKNDRSIRGISITLTKSEEDGGAGRDSFVSDSLSLTSETIKY